MFGYAVALSADGNMLAVGAFDEDGSARHDQRPARQPGQRLRRRLRVHAHRRDVVAAGVHQAVERRGAGLVRRARRAQRRRQHAAGRLARRGLRRDRRQRRRAATTTGATTCRWARPTCSCAAATTWSQQAFLKASNTGPNDWFGSRLALSGDGNIAVIGASLEDGSAKGINGNQNDDSATEAGAVYLFTRTGTTWRQQAYIKGVEHRGVRRVRQLGGPRSQRPDARRQRARRRQRRTR